MIFFLKWARIFTRIHFLRPEIAKTRPHNRKVEKSEEANELISSRKDKNVGYTFPISRICTISRFGISKPCKPYTFLKEELLSFSQIPKFWKFVYQRRRNPILKMTQSDVLGRKSQYIGLP